MGENATEDFNQIAQNYLKTALANAPTRCPFCGSEDVSYDNIEVDGSRVYQRVDCMSCRQGWHDGYTQDSVMFEDPQTEEDFYYAQEAEPPATPFPTTDATIAGPRIRHTVGRLMSMAAWFAISPLPEDEYRVTVKVENKEFIEREAQARNEGAH